MIAIEITQFGGPEVLQAKDRPIPKPQDHEVLIQVEAAGINRPDVMQRQGRYPPPEGASDIPGLEIAGTVVALGDKVSQSKPGDRVLALVSGGGYAEYCCAHETLCLPFPAEFTSIQAAALPETWFTVWSNVIDRGRLLKGETLLVHGGSSGIGTAAIQLGKLVGAQVIVTAGSEEKCRFCVELGARQAINYRQLDFVDEVTRITSGRGVDLILDMIGGDYFPRNLACLAEDGRLVQIAVQHGPKTELSLLPVMLKRLTVTGSTLRARNVAFKADIARQLEQFVWPWLSEGQIRPIVHATLPLTQAAEAHRLMESSQHIGKIILTV